MPVDDEAGAPAQHILQIARTRSARLTCAAMLGLAGLGGLAWSAPPRPRAALARAAEEVNEYKVKALSIQHFIGYTKWPKDAFEQPDSPLVVVVVGQDPFGQWLDEALKGKKFGERSIRIVRVEDLEKIADWPTVHLIFLASSHARQLPELLAVYREKPTLVVGDTAGLATDGAHVNFYIDSRRIGFEVNTDAVKRSHLDISSQMLKLARIVRDKQQEPAR